MRKFNKYILILLSLSAISCTDYLDKSPDDELTLEMVFSDKIRTEDWLAYCYQGVKTNWDAPYGMVGLTGAANDVAPQPRWMQFGWSVINWQTGNWNTTTTSFHNFWKELPIRIREAHIFIEKVMPNDAQLFYQSEVDLMKAECRFLIAYYYWMMVDAYGPVPFNPGITDSAVSSEELMLEQRPIYELIDWIDDELTEVAKILPPSYEETSKFGRATSIAALAVRARMRLFAASPLVNGNPLYKGYTNSKGEELYSTSYDASRWQKAYDGYKELLKVADANGNGLLRSYAADGDLDPFKTASDVFTKTITEGNTEILFARTDWSYGTMDSHVQPRGVGGNGALSVTQQYVDGFFMANGLPITDPNSGYSEKGFSDEADIRDTDWSGLLDRREPIADNSRRGNVAEAGTYNMYVGREPRFYTSVLFNGAWTKPGNRKTEFLYGQQDGGPSHDSPEYGYLLRRMIDPDAVPREGIFKYRHSILFRYTEAYMGLAETAIELGKIDEAMKIINEIRNRAYIPEYGSGTDSNGFTRISYDSDKASVTKLYRMERFIELSCESAIAFNDGRRWLTAEKDFNGPSYGMNCNGTVYTDDPSEPKAYFKRTVVLNRIFEKKNYWLPVPQSEIDKNPNLRQNPFWSE